MADPQLPLPEALTSRSTRWLLNLGIALLVVLGVVLLVLLTQATSNRDRYGLYYERLILINGVVALLLLVTIAWGSLRLLMRWRKRQFGARLLVKLAAIFAFVGLLPGTLIYFVSYQFVSRSIESWFDIKVEGALAAGLSLGRATIDTLSVDAGKQARSAAQQLIDVNDELAPVVLERLREQTSATDVVLWSATGRAVASAGQSRFQINPVSPGQAVLRDVRARGSVQTVEGLEESNTGGDKAVIKALALVPRMELRLDTEPRILQLTLPLPPTLVTNALDVQIANREYQERALAREGLRRMYIGTLTLSLFMAVLGAIVLAVLLGNQLARPLLMLAMGMRQVAAGDLRPKLTLQSRDELGGLTRSFADMTQQLADARKAVEQTLEQLESARGNLQTILDNLTAGVIVMRSDGQIVSSNPGATRVLRVPVAAHEGQALSSLPGLDLFAQGVLTQFAQLGAEAEGYAIDHWQKSFDIHAAGQGLSETSVTLVARGAVLPDGMWLLVFDDISEIVSAQRAQAWGEVARRLAHEIKNPLTPIQLSAERLQRRLADRLEPADQALLDKSVRTIADQVDAMKRLVNEFRDYARLPAAELRPTDLNDLLQDLASLYPRDDQDAHKGVAVRLEADPACPPILADAQQLRQVVHNLVQNAQDAAEAARAHRQPRVCIRTEWLAGRRQVRLTVQDSGEGFAPTILRRAFEPYVTTKVKGTGLGLAVVKKIADEHGARIELSNIEQDGQTLGAKVSLSFRLDKSQDGSAGPL
ncbi:ATP-binding protein [Limnohabitans sp.]|jgi:nitrogen fixation/metabolism regulation signal transduction histidine kinase|uniref:sensor histidine kinase n=1 Tax=Limnohabitans sp. TaxID=1907725 RepID=UPI00391B75A6